MNPSPETPDPLLNCLLDEVADLPGLAAREARRMSAQRSRHRRQGAVVLLIVAIALGVSSTFLPSHPKRKEMVVQPSQLTPSRPATPPEPADYVKVQTVREAMSDPLPLPTGLNREQKDLLEAARGLPLLLVKDASGKVTRIHVIER